MKPKSLSRFRFTTQSFHSTSASLHYSDIQKRLSYHESNTLQLRILFAQALKTISRKYWIVASWKLMKGRNLMSNRKCWKAARWRCEEFKCRHQRPRRSLTVHPVYKIPIMKSWPQRRNYFSRHGGFYIHTTLWGWLSLWGEKWTEHVARTRDRRNTKLWT